MTYILYSTSLVKVVPYPPGILPAQLPNKSTSTKAPYLFQFKIEIVR